MDFLDEGIKRIDEALRSEWKKVINDEIDNNITEKINKQISRTGFQANEKEILDIIKSDKSNLLLSLFCKNPIKQNFVENFIFEQIKNCGAKFKRCQNFPSGVDKYMINGEVANDNFSDKLIKTIDYEFVMENGKEFLCSQKYTTGRGSSQDDRFNEVRHFIESNKIVKDKNTIPVALIDGSYYNRSKRDSDISNFELLRDPKFCGDVLVLPYLEFIDKLKNNEL